MYNVHKPSKLCASREKKVKQALFRFRRLSVGDKNTALYARSRQQQETRPASLLYYFHLYQRKNDGDEAMW